MKIAYLLPAPGIPLNGPSGASAHVRDLCSALRKEHEVKIFAARRADHRGTFGEKIAAEICGVPCWPSWLPGFRDLIEIRAARRIEKSVLQFIDSGWFPNLIIERHSLFSDAGWRISERFGIPWLLEVNAPLFLERQHFETLIRPSWAAKWQQEVLLAAPFVMAVSSWLTSWLHELGCTNVKHIPNGVTKLVGDRTRGRHLLGVDNQQRLIGFVGSMKPWHGVSCLLEVAKQTNCKLALIGEGIDIPNAICKSFYSPQDLADVVAAFDVGLAPYPASAPAWFCPLKILLYRAQGIPIVATNVGDCEPLVAGSGMVVPPGDVNALIKGVHQVWGKTFSRDVCDWNQVGQKMIEFVKNR